MKECEAYLCIPVIMYASLPMCGSPLGSDDDVKPSVTLFLLHQGHAQSCGSNKHPAEHSCLTMNDLIRGSPQLEQTHCATVSEPCEQLSNT